MTLSARDRRAFVIGAAGLAIICLARFALMPWIDSWSDARQQIATGLEELTTHELTISRVLGQRGRLAAVYGPSVNRPLTDPATARIDLLAAAQGVLKKASFVPKGYQPQRSKQLRQVPGLTLVPLQVRGQCKLGQLAKCLAGMPEAETLIIVDRLTVTNDKKKPGNLDVTIVLVTLAEQAGGGS